MQKPILFFLATLLIASWGVATTHADSPANTVTYEVTFDNTWSNVTHPDPNFPTSNYHYSRLVGTTHNNTITLWREGQHATPGIENVAELGYHIPLDAEVNAHIANGDAYSWIRDDSSLYPDANGVGQMVHQFDTDANNPYVSLVSMIAPSPDWIVGVDSLNLQDASGNWLQTVTVTAYPYDAGTEEGIGYSLSNPATDPHEPISNITGVSPFSNQPLGTFTFELQTVPSAVSLQSQGVDTLSTSALPVIVLALTILAITSMSLTQKKPTVTIPIE